jgi:hypothetical protein
VNKETVEHLACIEADVTNMPRDDAVKHLLFHLLKQLTRIADSLEKAERERRGY